MNKCKHCGQTTTLNNEFCCNGCSVAYNLIHSFNLAKYYKYCKEIYKKAPLKIDHLQNTLSYDEYVIELKNNVKQINLLVEGIHCGSCVWLIENILKKIDGVLKVNLNLSSKKLILEWQGCNNLIDQAMQKLFELGYKVIPYTPEAFEYNEKLNEKYILIKIAVAGFGSIATMMILWSVWAGNFDKSMGQYVRLINHICALTIALPVILYSGKPFFTSAVKSLLNLKINMDVPIALGIIGTTFISIYQTFIEDRYTYFDAATNLIFFLLIGRFLELKSKNYARNVAENLILRQPKTITLVVDDNLILVSLKKAKVSDIAFASAGERIAADGIVVEGESEVDNQLITGESRPVKISVGARVSAGTINLTNSIKYRILSIGSDTMLSEILKLIDIAERNKSYYVRIADRVAKYFTPFIIVCSLMTFVTWFYFWHADFNTSLINAITVMVITCPCALGLAIPIVQVIASSKLLSRGIILKSEDALEKLGCVNLVVFDKTGTLTSSNPQLANKNDIDQDDLRIICSLASYSKHILCKSIASNEMIFQNSVDEIRGMGIKTRYKGQQLKLGNRKFCGVSVDPDDNLMEIWFKKGNKHLTRLTFENQLKSDAILTIKKLKSKCFNIEILSGDHMSSVELVAKQLNIIKFQAHMNPLQKYDYLLDLQSCKTNKVMMVGDGLNDAAALKVAYVSMSPSTSLEISQVEADIIFQTEKLQPIVDCIDIARNSNKLAKQNLILSLVYNFVSIPVAFLGYINPIIAAISMSLSSIIVILNSLRLKKKS